MNGLRILHEDRSQQVVLVEFDMTWGMKATWAVKTLIVARPFSK